MKEQLDSVTVVMRAQLEFLKDQMRDRLSWGKNLDGH